MLLSYHILGSATKETRIAMANLAIDNIEEFFKTGNCKNRVNKKIK